MQIPSQRIPPFAHEHDPFWHAVPAEQSVSHAPQFALSVCRSTQVLPQDCCPAGHAVHTPPMHASPGEHAFPQPPQFSGSELVSTHPVGDDAQ